MSYFTHSFTKPGENTSISLIFDNINKTWYRHRTYFVRTQFCMQPVQDLERFPPVDQHRQADNVAEVFSSCMDEILNEKYEFQSAFESEILPRVMYT